MLELSPSRKNKINLQDYNFQQDIANRMVLSDLSSLEHEILEEILFSSLKFSLKKLARNVGCEEEQITPVIKKLARAGLLQIQDDAVVVDKEMRKYFEFQLSRFDPEFKPDMEFLQGLLKKIPIHLLPTWYAIPRTSNNIFESIVEKYLLTPQIFQRYLMDLNLGDVRVNGVMSDVFSAPDFKISSSDLIAKHNLSRPDFEEILLLLELNFVCCLIYEKEEGHWNEFVVPFYEWHQYLRFLRDTEAPSLAEEATILRKRESDFAFIEDMTLVLEWVKRHPTLSPPDIASKMGLPLHASDAYIEQIVHKLCLVNLLERKSTSLHLLDGAHDWFDMNSESRALYLYRHPQNRLLAAPPHLSQERLIREAEKAIKRVLHGKWVLFDDFIKGCLVPLNEESVPVLRKTGRHWKYTLPTYNEEEKELIHSTVFEWLFEMGMVAVGTCQGRDCFSTTAFGRFFFEE